MFFNCTVFILQIFVMILKFIINYENWVHTLKEKKCSTLPNSYNWCKYHFSNEWLIKYTYTIIIDLSVHCVVGYLLSNVDRTY